MQFYINNFHKVHILEGPRQGGLPLSDLLEYNLEKSPMC